MRAPECTALRGGHTHGSCSRHSVETLLSLKTPFSLSVNAQKFLCLPRGGRRSAADTSCVICVKRENGACVSGETRCGGSRSGPLRLLTLHPLRRSALRAVTSRGETSSVNSELIIHEADDTTQRRRSKQEAWLVRVKVVELTEVKFFKLSK